MTSMGSYGGGSFLKLRIKNKMTTLAAVKEVASANSCSHMTKDDTYTYNYVYEFLFKHVHKDDERDWDPD